MSGEEIKRELLTLIRENDYMNGAGVEEIEDDTDISAYGFTSISVIDLITKIEGRFDFRFEDADLLFDRTNTLNKLIEIVRKSGEGGAL
jgi:acyl carrier protein